MRIILSTVPREGAYRSWITPGIIEPKEVKYLPLGLLSLASNISTKEHDVEIIDPFSDGWSIQQTADYINERHPDVVGFTAATRWSYALHELLRATYTPWRVVGGPHCTHHAEELLVWGADTVFVGPLADEEFREWLRCPNSGIIPCKTNINDITFPNRNLVKYEDYFFKGKVLFEAKKRMSMFSSVGCPNACKFCSVQTKRVQYKRPADVVGEMLYLKNIYGAESIHIFDDNFNANGERLNSVLEWMERDGWDMEWSMRGQVKFDLSTIPRMKRLGLKRIHVGIESFDDNSLRWMRKNHRYDDIVKFCQACNESEIEILGYFIVGLPGEADAYLESFPDKCKELKITRPYVNVLFPEPDTEYGIEAGLTPFWNDYFHSPKPDAEIPHPMGEEYKNTLSAKAERIIKELNSL